MEHHVAGHRRHHPDRRADDHDPHPQRRGALLHQAAHIQVHDTDRFAGEGPRARGAGRGRQPARQEGRRAVPRRPHAVSARRRQSRGAARQRGGRPEGSRGVADGRQRQGRRIARGDRASRSAHGGSRRPPGTRAQARRAEPRARTHGRGQSLRSRAGRSQSRRARRPARSGAQRAGASDGIGGTIPRIGGSDPAEAGLEGRRAIRAGGADPRPARERALAPGRDRRRARRATAT